MDVQTSNLSDFRINPKHALGTTLLGPGFIFELNRVVQTFHSTFKYLKTKLFFVFNNILSLDKSSRFGQGTWSLSSLHNLYYVRYSIHMNDFIIVDPNEKKSKF